ncbi:MAG: hypothetical protein SF028_08895 [Candidatus Sumerlaeia bacterium]|nr:hypothetical protein [Candidatus Sumerlaeia bacterium]
MSDTEERVCDQCGSYVESNQTLYRLRVELVAEPHPGPIGDSAGGSVLEDLEALVRRLEAMSDEEVAEATAQVHERFDSFLCAACRKRVRAALLARQRIINLHTD